MDATFDALKRGDSNGNTIPGAAMPSFPVAVVIYSSSMGTEGKDRNRLSGSCSMLHRDA
jgi:hypothetical protein